ncbi:hypothetical protein DRW41_10535 [Neobacillus piezotolerans]|uniref:Uncharacterized protein n=1 Tax=Neobacillus piezotolerans TaxID=2259171 RepID=A0A3D8GS75_9BACI|nr:hypothetical protein DRW41_10535 [Neobacillus piezotolerans]
MLFEEDYSTSWREKLARGDPAGMGFAEEAPLCSCAKDYSRMINFSSSQSYTKLFTDAILGVFSGSSFTARGKRSAWSVNQNICENHFL